MSKVSQFKGKKNVRYVNNRQDDTRIREKLWHSFGLRQTGLKQKNTSPTLVLINLALGLKVGKRIPPKSISLPLLSSPLDWVQAILGHPVG